MAKNEHLRIGPKVLDKDVVTHDALQKITEYKPSTDGISLANLQKLRTDMELGQAKESQLEAALRTQRDITAAQEWAFHNAMLAAKDQVKAQFTKNGNQVQEVGLKKASEYKRRRQKQMGAAKS